MDHELQSLEINDFMSSMQAVDFSLFRSAQSGPGVSWGTVYWSAEVLPRYMEVVQKHKCEYTDLHPHEPENTQRALEHTWATYAPPPPQKNTKKNKQTFKQVEDNLLFINEAQRSLN